jgi:hypothetical protein
MTAADTHRAILAVWRIRYAEASATFEAAAAALS